MEHSPIDIMMDTQTPVVKKRRKNNFLDNKLFYSELVNYKLECNRAKEEGRDKPAWAQAAGSATDALKTLRSSTVNP
jgi:hypothetical protein